jgi:calcineurin-like phosphoesterase family protein
MAIWFTSDPHFGHANIIKYSNRPYSVPILDKFNKPVLDDDGKPKVFLDVDRMDQEMIRNWNSVVGPDDTVYIIGDFSMGKGHRTADFYLDQLNGIKHLIWGNHDPEETRTNLHWASSQPYLEIKLDGFFIVLCHYSMRVWNRSHRNSLMLYGHSHGSLPGDAQSLDVGMDCWDLKPVSLKEILRRMKTLPIRVPVDHHGR